MKKTVVYICVYILVCYYVNIIIILLILMCKYSLLSINMSTVFLCVISVAAETLFAEFQ